MDLAWLKLQNCNKIAGVNSSLLHLSAEGMKRGRDWVNPSGVAADYQEAIYFNNKEKTN